MPSRRRASTASRRARAGGRGANASSSSTQPTTRSARAASKLAMKPQVYRRGAAGKAIAYAIGDSPLGRLLVAATSKGICAVFLSESDAKLERALRDEFPAATFAAGHAGLGKWMREIIRHLQGRRPRLELPLDIQATAFQWQVWNALSRIPYGETRTYKEVAASIG